MFNQKKQVQFVLAFLFMKWILTILISLVFFIVGNSQSFEKKKVNIGTEQDFLPYITGGYYASI